MIDSWWICQTEVQREHLVRLLLMRHGFTTYAPRIKHRGRIAFLFPTYVFVGAAAQWSPIRWTRGVTQVLMSGNQPARLPHKIIAELHSRERDGFVKLPTQQRGLRKGQNVRIVRGSFCDQIGLYDGMSSHDRARVLLELLGRKVTVDLPENDVKALDVVAQR
jgi:transcriptional antiterminator RfaH